ALFLISSSLRLAYPSSPLALAASNFLFTSLNTPAPSIADSMAVLNVHEDSSPHEPNPAQLAALPNLLVAEKALPNQLACPAIAPILPSLESAIPGIAAEAIKATPSATSSFQKAL